MAEILDISDVQLPGASWKLRVATHQEIFPKTAVYQAQKVLRDWSAVFPKGNTWVGREYGVPSLIVRLDCVVEENGTLKIFEVEDRPCGGGIASHVVPGFKDTVAALQKEWPPFQWVIGPNRETDDALWLGQGITLEQAKSMDGLLLVRSRPEDREFHCLEPRSVSTVQHEGDKRCCAEPPLSICSLLKWIIDPSEQAGGYIEGLPGGPFVVKPWKGTRAREVRVYLNGHTPNKINMQRKEKLSFGDLERWMKGQRLAVCQPLIPPMQRSFLPQMNMICRAFFGYSPTKASYIPLGGLWMASRSLVVHGNSESISGPLMLED